MIAALGLFGWSIAACHGYGASLFERQPIRLDAWLDFDPNGVLSAVSLDDCAGRAVSIKEHITRFADGLAAGLQLDRAEKSSPSLLAALQHQININPVAARLLLYSGHARSVIPDEQQTQRITHLCLPEGMVPAQRLIEQLDLAGSTVVIVLNACDSAYVDISKISIPISVISSSPGKVGVRSGFSEDIQAALIENIDLNHDGIATDYELFTSIRDRMKQRHSSTQHPAVPKIRRQASSHIPLPVRAPCDLKCRRVKQNMQVFINNLQPEEKARQLQCAMERQLELSTGVKVAELPRVERDYFIVSAKNDLIRKKVSDAAARVLDPFPSQDRKAVEAVARFIMFAEIYHIEASSAWIRVIRLRDQHLMATRMVPEEGVVDASVLSAIPKRIDLKSHPGMMDHYIVRITHRVPTQPVQIEDKVFHPDKAVPIPCIQAEGQCFVIRNR